MSDIQQHLDPNIVTSGIVIMLAGAAMALLRNLPRLIVFTVLRRMVVTVDVADHDPAFFWIQSWLARHPYMQRARILTASTRTKPDSTPTGNDSSVAFSPAPGWHLLWYRGKPILLRRDRKETEGTFGALAYRETFVLRATSRSVIADIVAEAKETARPVSGDTIGIYRRIKWGWHSVQRRKPRPLSSVVMPYGVAENLLADARRFLSSADQYKKLGVPWRRGYLLYGPPGSGKTSMAMALGGELHRDVYIIGLAGLSDSMLANAFDESPDTAVLLIEDIDCAFHGRSRSEETDEELTFSGLLNALDGVAAKEGRLLFMTTNHPEKLDPALRRPGRCDVEIEFGNATTEMGRRLFERFFPDHKRLAEEFGAVLASVDAVSMASIQERLIRHRDDPLGAVHSFLPERCRSNGAPMMGGKL